MTEWIVTIASVFVIAIGGIVFGLYLQHRNRSAS